jgi:nicotinamidase-related amidase
MDINKNDTAVLVTDPQNDFLSEQGVTWQLVGDSVRENRTVENIESLIQVAKSNGYEVFISPHYYTPPIMAGNSREPSRKLCTISTCLIVRGR